MIDSNRYLTGPRLLQQYREDFVKHTQGGLNIKKKLHKPSRASYRNFD